MSAALSERIAQLPTLPKAKLLLIWAEVFNAPPPPTLRKELMVPILAYRVQEREYGGLSQSARRRLKEIAAGLPKGKRTATVDMPSPSTDTKLIRIWRGEPHEVICRDGQYEYKGRQFGSLSRIAKEITGTQWSGPAFFGTKEKAK